MDREVEPRLHWRDNNYSMHAAAFDQQFCRKLLSELQVESGQLRTLPPKNRSLPLFASNPLNLSATTPINVMMPL